MPKKNKLLFFIAEDWAFCSHRLSLAIAAKEAGYDVTVVTRVNNHGSMIVNNGIALVPIKSMSRSGINPIREISVIIEIWRIYKNLKPDLVHQVGFKPVIYGSLVSRILRINGIVNAVAGLGFVFTSKKILAKLLRPLVKMMLLRLLNYKNTSVIVQNNHDLEVLRTEIGLKKCNFYLISGAGVNPSLYNTKISVTNPPLVVLISRMLWDKGIGDFVKAAHIIKNLNVNARFALIGSPDLDNPTSIPEKQLKAWHESGIIEWWGHRSDIPYILKKVSIFCLPTFYGEGMPKVLIEAMASSLPIITTDIPGCRELVAGGKNGLLIAPHDVKSLSASILKLINNPDLCAKMGKSGRLMVEKNLSLEKVIQKTLLVYKKTNNSHNDNKLI